MHRAVIRFLISRNLCMYTCNNLQVSWEYNVQWWLATPITSSKLSRDRCYGRRPLMTALIHVWQVFPKRGKLNIYIVGLFPKYCPAGPLCVLQPMDNSFLNHKLFWTWSIETNVQKVINSLNIKGISKLSLQPWQAGKSPFTAWGRNSTIMSTWEGSLECRVNICCQNACWLRLAMALVLSAWTLRDSQWS